LRQDGGDIDGAQVVLVVKGLRADFDEARRGVDDAVVVVLTRGDPGGDEERLHGGTGLEDVSHGAIAIRARRHVLAVVRVVGGLVDHGEYLARGDVEHDYGAARGT